MGKLLVALVLIMSAVWSSAYVRNDHAIAERSFCREGYPADNGEQVPQMRALVEEVFIDIDTNVRAELPALSEIDALTPPHGAEWSWRRVQGSNRWFGIF